MKKNSKVNGSLNKEEIKGSKGSNSLDSFKSNQNSESSDSLDSFDDKIRKKKNFDKRHRVTDRDKEKGKNKINLRNERSNY